MMYYSEYKIISKNLYVFFNVIWILHIKFNSLAHHMFSIIWQSIKIEQFNFTIIHVIRIY